MEESLPGAIQVLPVLPMTVGQDVETSKRVALARTAGYSHLSSMKWTGLENRRSLVMGGCFGIAILCFLCSIHWDIDQLVLPASLCFSLGLLSIIPVYTCGACGRIDIFRRRRESCTRCRAEHRVTTSTFLLSFPGRQRLLLDIPIALCLLFFGSIRLLCLPALLLHVLIAILAPAAKCARWLNCTAILFLALLFAPVDIEVGGVHGPHFGVARNGPRLVRLVMGMPMITVCTERYGEFISGGCIVMGNEPVWLLVWEEAGLTPWKTKPREPPQHK